MTAVSGLRDPGESALVAAAQAGDRRAFAALVERNYDFVFRAAWRWTANRADAEDVAQDVCMRLATAVRTFRGQSSLRTLLYAITLNAVRDWGRKRRREEAMVKGFAVQSLLDAVAVADDPVERLWDAVRLLPEQQRDAVLLVHGEGLSHAQAADAMACAEKTVSWHLHEARKRLRAMLGEKDDPR
jgi:RNA polymerase sigma-70 factor (ECF subfamily)